MRQEQSHIIPLFKLSLLLFFIVHYSNSTMFYHSHVIDGQIYCHSHFWGLNFNTKSVPVSNHTHTTGQINLIHLFNQFHLTADLDFPIFIEADTNFVLILTDNRTNKALFTIPDLLRLRAPPAC